MNRSLPLHGALPGSDSPRQLALGAKGFRPFFLLAGVFAAAIVPAWVLVLVGTLPPSPYLAPNVWHAHEMIFGFTAAVIAGFLLTAVGNWTQRETLTGTPLLGLAGLWLAGRIAVTLSGVLPRGVPAAVDLAFLPILIVVLARPLVAAGNRRNFVMLAVLTALFAADVVTHLDALGIAAPGEGRHACLVALDVVVLVILVMAGRVFPMFTRNASGATSIRSSPTLDKITVATAAVLAVVDAFDRDVRLAAAVAGIVAVVAAARAARWGAWQGRRIPLLWILHAGYAWIVAGLALRAVAAVVPSIPDSLATHAVTAGGIGSLTLGMMARVSLGHTGRPLVAPRLAVWAFGAVTVAALVRVLGPLVAPAWSLRWVAASALYWLGAFSLFVAAYARILASPRADGKAG